MREFTYRFELFSTRWGHADSYTLRFSEEGFTFDAGGKDATYREDDSGEPVWTGHNYKIENPIVAILHNDKIYADEVVASAVVSAWERWRDNEVTESELQDGLKLLFDWVNLIGENKPRGEFWAGVF